MTGMFAESTLLHLLSLMVAVPLAIMAWRSADRLGPASIVIRSLLLYLLGAHLIKGQLLAAVDWQPAVDAGVVPRLLTETEAALTAQIILVYSLAVMFSCLCVTSMLRTNHTIGTRQAVTNEMPNKVLQVTLYCLAVILPYKYFINHVMRWGVPALTPTNTIPLFTGISVYLVRDASLCLCATALYQCFVVIGRPSRRQSLLTLLASFGYVAIDLAMGSKFAMLGMLFTGISLATRAFLQQDTVGRLRTILISLLVITIVLPTYQAANVLRYINLENGFDLIDIILKTSDKVDLDLLSIVFAVLGRATGAEGVAAAVVLDGRLSLSFLDLFLSSDFGPQYTFALSGIGEDNLAFGATLAGTYSLLCRADILCTGVLTYFVMLALLGAVIWLVLNMPVQPAIKYGVATSLALVVVHAQLASGGILVFGNRIFVIFVAGWLIELLLRSQRPSTSLSIATLENCPPCR